MNSFDTKTFKQPFQLPHKQKLYKSYKSLGHIYVPVSKRKGNPRLEKEIMSLQPKQGEEERKQTPHTLDRIPSPTESFLENSRSNSRASFRKASLIKLGNSTES